MPHRAAITPPRAGEMSRADDAAAVSVAKVEAIRSGSVRSATYAFNAGSPKIVISYRKMPGSSQPHDGAAKNSSAAGGAAAVPIGEDATQDRARGDGQLPHREEKTQLHRRGAEVPRVNREEVVVQAEAEDKEEHREEQDVEIAPRHGPARRARGRLRDGRTAT